MAARQGLSEAALYEAAKAAGLREKAIREARINFLEEENNRLRIERDAALATVERIRQFLNAAVPVNNGQMAPPAPPPPPAPPAAPMGQPAAGRGRGRNGRARASAAHQL